MKKGKVFSGARPTGRQHIGNYLGAIRNYVALQDDYDCVYCVVDLHALTTLTDTQVLKTNTREMVLDWLAAGMDPEKSIIFVQSHVPQVTELHTILSMVTPMGWLTRLPTFKEKVRLQPDNVNYGLLGYPVLMAADITLYKADTVPVGEDQAPHLEFTREIVRRFNHHFGPTLVEPQIKLTPFPRVMGVDGVNKMSKSLDNHIELASSPEEIERRVMTMVTDPQRRYRTDPGRPEVCNVFSFHGFFSPQQIEEIEGQCRNAEIGCVECKRVLARNLAASLAPFREQRAKLAADPKLVWDILEDGASRARAVADETMAEVRARVGLP
ncbi:MAG: tryptophan--tRNA ligase [Anaerolineae bacterium]|nr:tryptophan--tRNA ligase [Anaerolineae bacterium]NIN98706.1 tryptophan--tRNA ligase [Anaerolineae bacterium]NIQ81596.1 tryptophan--tRNA ligase [Anaerolineae bacterium]